MSASTSTWRQGGNQTLNAGVNLLFNALRFNQARESQPAAPTPWSREMSGYENRSNILLRTPEAQSSFGSHPLTRVMNERGDQGLASRTSLHDIKVANLETEAQRIASQEEFNQRMIGVTEDFRGRFETGMEGVAGAAAAAEQAGVEGKAAYQRGRNALADSLASVSENAAAAVQAAASSVQAFFKETADARSRMYAMGEQNLAQIKDHTAARMVEVTNSVAKQTNEAVTEYWSGAMAAGVPMQQAMNTMAQIQAAGAQSLGNLQVKIGVEEDTIATQARIEQFKVLGTFESAGVSSTGMVTSKAMETVGDAMANLGARQVEIAKANALLEESAANFGAQTALNRANVHALFTQLAMDGSMAMADLVSAVELPIVQLGPILEADLTAAIGLEQLEFQNRMVEYGQNMANTDQFVEGITGVFGNLAAANERRYDSERYYRARTQDRTANIAGGIFGAAASTGGSAMEASATRAAAGV